MERGEYAVRMGRLVKLLYLASCNSARIYFQIWMLFAKVVNNNELNGKIPDPSGSWTSFNLLLLNPKPCTLEPFSQTIVSLSRGLQVNLFLVYQTTFTMAMRTCSVTLLQFRNRYFRFPVITVAGYISSVRLNMVFASFVAIWPLAPLSLAADQLSLLFGPFEIVLLHPVVLFIRYLALYRRQLPIRSVFDTDLRSHVLPGRLLCHIAWCLL